MNELHPPSMDFLTPDESTAVDAALMTARERFSTRVAIYSLRSLKQIAQENGVTIAQLEPHQIEDWIFQDPSLQTENGFDSSFKGFFTQLVMSSLKPLTRMSNEAGVAIEDLTVPQVVQWFEKEAKQRLEQGN